MNTKPVMSDNQESGTPFGHAVVIGSSIAGLTIARVLTDHFARVTIIERDRLPDTPDFRRSVPQARHAHTLPLRGQMILEQQFPGLTAELVANGAISINGGSEMAFFIAGGWHEVSHPSAVVYMTSSRPLLETTIYRRLAKNPRVHIIQEHEVVGLQVDERGERVTGVRLRDRHAAHADETELLADLVVDASGRDSRAPQWLESLGYPTPQEETVNAFAGYATRIYQRPTGFNAGWKTLYIRPTPPNGTRGGIILPIEGDRWHVTLVGMAHDYPPTDEEGFLAFARSLPSQELYEAIKEARPLTKPYGYRRSESRLRHYEKLPRYLEGFLVSGDAVYTLNPVYAQGMTAAAMASLALDRSLQAQRRWPGAGNLTGLAREFQQQLSRVEAEPWRMVTSQDRHWPTTEVTQDIVPAHHRAPDHRFNPVPVRTGYQIAHQ
jgi:2-polyprenyl-6-methoxyphenol hydroxylase-like FAD-dependent oxidoreductase